MRIDILLAEKTLNCFTPLFSFEVWPNNDLPYRKSRIVAELVFTEQLDIRDQQPTSWFEEQLSLRA